jgi:Cyclic nucleotide-binding domain
MAFSRREAVTPVLARVLHVRRTELRRTLQVAGFAIVVGWAMYTAFSASQSIFLNKAGPAAYPVFFIVLALAVWPMDALQGALTRRFGVGRAFRINLVANAVAAVCVFVAYTVREDATVAFTAYVVYSVAFELVMLHFWSFVTQHFNVLEGKRIFPVIAAGSSVGYILSGVTTTIVAVFATEPLIFVWAFGSLAAAVMSVNLERTLYRPAFVDDADELLVAHHVERKRRGFVAVLARAVEHVTGSRLVLALVVLGVVVGIASRIGDYLVAVIFVAATHDNLQSLTILIGDAWLVSYAIQLVISLFVAPWVLGRLGVKNAILVLPLFTFAGFAAVAVNPVLVTSLLLFIVRNGLQTGLDDPAQNVLGGALPGQVVPRLRFMLDNAVLPGAAAASGAALLVFQAAAGSNARVLAMVGVGISLLFLAAAWWVRSLYLEAVYTRLHAHALSLADFQRAVGRPTAEQLAELVSMVRHGDGRTREVAAAALAQASPDAFAELLPELLASGDPLVRRLALETAPPERLTADQLDGARTDADAWVRAAAAVAGANREQPWPHSRRVLAGLRHGLQAYERAAAVWAAGRLGDGAAVVTAMGDPHAAVRLEAIGAFARMKGQVDGIAGPLIASLEDTDVDVRREALRQVARWTPPAELRERFAQALVALLASTDRDTRRLASDAMASQAPDALALALPLLAGRGEAAITAVEALIRSGRPELYRKVRLHLERQLAEGVHLASISARVAAAGRGAEPQAAAPYALLRIGLDDYIASAGEAALAAMRALHAKRGFATVERGLASPHAATRVEAVETLINFGPSWLAAPLARLLEPESFAPTLGRPVSAAELDALGRHSDRWVRETAQAATHGISEHMKELITLKQVPLFSGLNLDQLAAVDRLMVTRHYAKGESVFRRGDVGAELYVVVEGEIRVHLDHGGREVTLARHGPGGVVGEMSVFDDQPRSASAQAMTDTAVRVLRRDRLHAIVHDHPEVLLEFIKSLSQRLRAMDEKVEAEPVVDAEAAPTP